MHVEDEAGEVLEADLDEIYFYKIDHPGGYAYQRVYNDDRSIDGVMLAAESRCRAGAGGLSSGGRRAWLYDLLSELSWRAARSRWRTAMTRLTRGCKGTWTFIDPRSAACASWDGGVGPSPQTPPPK